jgi:hypothetical protein
MVGVQVTGDSVGVSVGDSVGVGEMVGIVGVIVGVTVGHVIVGVVVGQVDVGVVVGEVVGVTCSKGCHALSYFSITGTCLGVRMVVLPSAYWLIIPRSPPITCGLNGVSQGSPICPCCWPMVGRAPIMGWFMLKRVLPIHMAVLRQDAAAGSGPDGFREDVPPDAVAAGQHGGLGAVGGRVLGYHGHGLV